MKHYFLCLLLFFSISTNFALAENCDYAKRAIELFQINDTKGAIKILNEGISKEPKNVELYLIRGPLFGQLGKNKEALSDYNKVIGLDESKSQKFFLASAYYNRAILESNDKLVAKAEADFKKAIEIDPRLSLAYVDYGQFLINQKKYSDAITYIEKGKKIINGAAPDEVLKRIEVLLSKARNKGK